MTSPVPCQARRVCVAPAAVTQAALGGYALMLSNMLPIALWRLGPEELPLNPVEAFTDNNHVSAALLGNAAKPEHSKTGPADSGTSGAGGLTSAAGFSRNEKIAGGPVGLREKGIWGKT